MNRAYDAVARWVDRRFGWDRLPLPLGLLTFIGLRSSLRRHNLYDTGGEPSTDLPAIEPPTPRHRVARTLDGSYNDLDNPRMGMVGSRFGRNVPLDRTWPQRRPDILEPSPREVSRKLLTRTEFVPATSVNSLVAAWLQFMIRDWFSHGKSLTENPWEIQLAPDDRWPEPPLRIMRTRPDPTRPPESTTRPPTYSNANSPWWDASQLYGKNADHHRWLRSGADGKLRVQPDGLVPMPNGENNPAAEPGFWLGLGMLQTLFTLEHNAVCDMLRGHYPTWSDDEIFQRARLIVAALIAKIHTVEWTPAVISHPTTKIAMRANWWGIAGERISRTFGRIGQSEIVSGIVGGPTDHFGVPYSLTEEFVAVYRMHPLIRDEWSLRAVDDDRVLAAVAFGDIAGPKSVEAMRTYAMADLLYSFGTLPPGLVTLHNFPNALQTFVRPDGKLMDLGATDILRTRELGVPRYNEFRRLLRLEPAHDFDTLTDNPRWAAEMRRVYGNIEKVDLMVGLFAERRPEGFAFSDTAFRIFILMASRRLNSDRFFTRDYRPEVYTKQGLDWVADNTMATVLLRHYPQLAPALRHVDNAFAPWSRTSAT
jgi:hypothetical protein